MIILGFDPGRDKCGIAVMKDNSNILYHQVIESEQAIATINSLVQEYNPELLVMGNQTTAKSWQAKLEASLPPSLSIIMVNEWNSSVEASKRYWQMYPPQGLKRLIPQGLLLPPRPVDDIVAIILIERYLKSASEIKRP
jgi:RNase H-fold protein (predicted Holliday junction resolvase)